MMAYHNERYTISFCKKMKIFSIFSVLFEPNRDLQNADFFLLYAQRNISSSVQLTAYYAHNATTISISDEYVFAVSSIHCKVKSSIIMKISSLFPVYKTKCKNLKLN